ncbi:hypothetical protein B5E41_30165 [Rhizobium esperanzae]|uniref:Uncharacterized protein n=1 Tax=Rhizobium esperanzae TaxID=1967781 RepID=A0A246DKT2_9HYPH|nr:hypothetical protein [Rhizobium esperanzae]OWO89707.1 hypothetical protein B5E41_30165 [Rhizobium esperanzae]
MAKHITLSWGITPGAIFNVSVHAPTMSAADRSEIERIARKWGFLTPSAGDWTGPESSEAVQAFNNEARRDGFLVDWK